MWVYTTTALGMVAIKGRSGLNNYVFLVVIGFTSDACDGG